jgi:hypothetical protein
VPAGTVREVSNPYKRKEPHVVINNQLRAGYELTVELGLKQAVTSSEHVDMRCPEHGEELLRERAYTISGWFEAITCPGEGPCAYDATQSCLAVDGDGLFVE